MGGESGVNLNKATSLTPNGDGGVENTIFVEKRSHILYSHCLHALICPLSTTANSPGPQGSPPTLATVTTGLLVTLPPPSHWLPGAPKAWGWALSPLHTDASELRLQTQSGPSDIWSPLVSNRHLQPRLPTELWFPCPAPALLLALPRA